MTEQRTRAGQLNRLAADLLSEMQEIDAAKTDAGRNYVAHPRYRALAERLDGVIAERRSLDREMGIHNEEEFACDQQLISKYGTAVKRMR
jgi:hypothetical protein